MRLLCRYAGGLACLVTALALVACGGGPGSQPEPKQIGNIAFEQGEKVRTIPLSDKFNGANLTYSVTTSNRSVATATVDNDADTLTVTVVGAGTAAITVTAKNSGGEAKQTFTVTVPQPPAPDPDPDPAPVEIPDIPSLEKDAIRTIRLGDKFSGENLTYDASSSNIRVATVSVNNTADTLTVTAVGPGTATITVTAAQGSATQTKTFTVTVPQPAADEVAPTVRTGATTSVSVAQGGTHTVTLSTVFTGANLTYVVSSNADTVATARESGGTLTISGVSTGSATITIVATNTAGSSPAHAIAVTVTAPATTPTPTPPPTTSGTLTIERGESAKRTLAAGQALQEPADKGVTAERSPDGEPGNVWLITAKEKGTHKVTILSAGKVVGEITVEVPNSRPLRTDADHPDVIEITTYKANLNATTPTTPPLPDLDSFFTDEDTNDDRFYRIEDKPSWFLIETENGFLTDADDTTTDVFDFGYEVLKAVKGSAEKVYDFSVSLYASDGEDESTRPLVLKFAVPNNTGLSPVSPGYTLNQRGARYDFYNTKLDSPPANRLDVGPRRVIDHTVTFTLTDPADENAVGFGFANTLYQKWVDDKQLPADSSPTTTPTPAHYLGEDGNYDPMLPDETLTANKAEGVDYFILKSTGAVVARWFDTPALDGTPTVVFKLKETGSSGTIRIEYHVWTLSRDQRSPASDDPRDEIPTTKRIDSRTLTINVVTCSSPPDPIAACP